MHFLHLYTFKIGLHACLCAKNTWFSNANASVNISSRFSTAYFSTGRHAPLKSVTYGHEHPSSFVLSICLANKHWFRTSVAITQIQIIKLIK